MKTSNVKNVQLNLFTSIYCFKLLLYAHIRLPQQAIKVNNIMIN